MVDNALRFAVDHRSTRGVCDERDRWKRASRTGAHRAVGAAGEGAARAGAGAGATLRPSTLSASEGQTRRWARGAGGARVALGALASIGLIVAGIWLHEHRGRTDAALATGVSAMFVTITVAAQVY